MTFRNWTIAVAVIVACLASSNAWAQGLGGGGGGGFGGGGGLGGGGGGFGGQGGAGRTPGANTNSIGANMNSAGNLPLITARQTQGVFGARTLSAPHQQRYRAMMGRSQAGSGAGQYANSAQFRQRGNSSSTSGLGSFSSFSGMGGQAQANPNAATKRRRNAGATGTLKPGALQLGFRPPTPVKTQLTATLEQRLGKLLDQSALAVHLEGRTAVLQGSVASERDRDLAAQLVLLEPGISAVRNEISTPDSPPGDLPLSPPQDQSPTSAPDNPPTEVLPDPSAGSEPAAR